MIPDFKTFLRESIWSDMQDRGSGDLIKKENDVNLLNFEQMYDYLYNIFDCEDDAITSINNNGTIFGVSVCVVHLGNDSLYDLYIDYKECMDGDDLVIMIPVEALEHTPDRYSELEDKYYNLHDELNKKYHIYDRSDWDGTSMYAIEPKQGDVDNKFFLEVLYFIINNVDKPILKKK